MWTLTNTEEEESLHTEELLGCDLKPPKFLGEVPHPDALAVHPGFVHAVPGRVRGHRWHRAQSAGVMGRTLPDPANPPSLAHPSAQGPSSVPGVPHAGVEHFPERLCEVLVGMRFLLLE